MKTIVKVGIITAAVAAGVAAAKRLQLAERGAKVFDQAVDKAATAAEAAVVKAVDLLDKGLTKVDEMTTPKEASDGMREAEQAANPWTTATRQETGVGYPAAAGDQGQGERLAEPREVPRTRAPFGYGDVQHDGEGAGTR